MVTSVDVNKKTVFLHRIVRPVSDQRRAQRPKSNNVSTTMTHVCKPTNEKVTLSTPMNQRDATAQNMDRKVTLQMWLFMLPFFPGRFIISSSPLIVLGFLDL